MSTRTKEKSHQIKTGDEKKTDPKKKRERETNRGPVDDGRVDTLSLPALLLRGRSSV